MSLSAFTRSLGGLASISLAALALGIGPVSAQSASGGVVEAQSLGTLDLWSTPGRDTGLPADLWRGTSADLAKATLAQAVDKPLDPALALALRRALATGANAPEGGGSDQSLAGLRERTLLQLGDLDAANTILSRASGLETSEARSRVRAEAALLAGHDQEACDTGQQLQENRDGAWWMKLRVWCGLAQNHPEAAQIALDVWHAGGGKDAAFDRLATAAVTGVMPAKAPLKPSLSDPLNYVLSKKLNLDLTSAMGSAAPAVAAAAAQDASLPPPTRQAAANRALHDDVAQGVGSNAAPLDVALSDAMTAVSGGQAAGPALERLVDLGADPDPKVRARAQAAALILAAAGQPMSAAARGRFAAFDIPGSKTAAARTQALRLAGEGKRPGEALLLAVSISSQQGGALSAADRANIITAFGQAGLSADARGLALEGLIGLGRP